MPNDQKSKRKPAKPTSVSNKKGKPGVKHRPIAGEKIKRIETIVGKIVEGTRRAEICEFVRVRWGLGEAQADRYIAEANAIILAESNKTREQAVADHLAVRQQIRKLALNAKDWRAALAAAQDEAKLRDLYPDPKLRVIDWRDEVSQLLRDGKVSAEQVINEFGDDGARIVAALGTTANPDGTPAETSASEPSPTNPQT